MKGWWKVLKHAFKDFGADRCSEHAAALSYYTIFAIPPLLLLLLMLFGALVDPATLQNAIQGQFAGIMGQQGATAIQGILQTAKRPDMSSPLTAAIGIAGLVLGALGFFVALQSALDRAWDVAPDPKKGGIKAFIGQRMLSFGMVLAVGFLLLVSLVISAGISVLSSALSGHLPGGVSEVMLQGINFVVSLAVITVLFALIFKFLPDAHIIWRDIWVGALITAVLFVIGKSLIAIYLGHSKPGSAFGAAGSVILVLVWIYYSSLILLFGAEITQAYAVERGGGVRPKKGAVRIVEARAPNELANRPDGAGAAEHAEDDGEVRPDSGEGRAAD